MSTARGYDPADYEGGEDAGHPGCANCDGTGQFFGTNGHMEECPGYEPEPDGEPEQLED